MQRRAHERSSRVCCCSQSTRVRLYVRLPASVHAETACSCLPLSSRVSAQCYAYSDWHVFRSQSADAVADRSRSLAHVRCSASRGLTASQRDTRTQRSQLDSHCVRTAATARRRRRTTRTSLRSMLNQTRLALLNCAQHCARLRSEFLPFSDLKLQRFI